MYFSTALPRGLGLTSGSSPVSRRRRGGLIRLLGVLAFAASLQMHAQFTLPGGVRVQVPKGRTPVPRNLPTRESPESVCPNLVNWVKPVFDEYPEQDLMRVELSRLATMEIPLFADQNFKPFFHKAYTEMSPQDLDAIFRQQIIVCNQSSYRTRIPGVEYAFQTRSTNSRLSYTHLPASLAALQAARDNIARQLQAMQSPPLSDQGYESLVASKSVVAPYLPLLWPSERRTFEQARTIAQARLAPAALASKVEALLGAPPSLDSLRALREAPSKYRDLFSQVTAEQAISLRARLDKRVSDAGAVVLAEQRKLMLSFNGTRDGLQQGATWMQQFEAVDVKELNLPGAAELAGDYERTRQSQLAAKEPELRRRIQNAPNETALQPLLDESYPLPSDRSSPAYAQMQQAIAQRAAIFERQDAAQDAARQRAEAAREARLAASSPPPPRDAGRRPAQTTSTELESHAKFTAHGLSSEPIFTAIYLGDFDKVDFGRDDTKFGSVAGGYMEGYWDSCGRFLKKDRVDITRRECTGGYSHMVNVRTGMQVSPDTCQGWSDVPTGKFADRQLYTAVKATEGQQEKSLMSNILKSVDNAKSLSDIYTQPINMAAELAQIGKDAGALIEMNGCTSPELQHFQSNLLLFAFGKQGISPGGSRVEYEATRAASPGQTFQDSDYQRMLERMVSNQAKSWAFNKYVPDTVQDVRVDKRDAMGRPASISGRYAYLRMGASRQQGEVTLSFSDGLPECLYFSDLPSNCVTPDRKLIAAYGNGCYRSKTAVRNP